MKKKSLYLKKKNKAKKRIIKKNFEFKEGQIKKTHRIIKQILNLKKNKA